MAGIDEAAGKIYYVSTEPSPLERHLYSIGLDGSAKRRLTSEKGTHAISLGPNGWYLDRFSSLGTPPRETVHRNDGSEAAVLREPDIKTEEYDLPRSEIVSFKASDGALLYGRLIKPPNFTDGKKYPVIVFVYGGPQAQTVVDAWRDLGLNEMLAARGFLVWQMDNRGSSGRGHKWESVVFRDFGEHELEDQKAGIRYLESLGFADTSRMAITGWSYGGFMTLYTLLHAPGLFRAGLAGAPVTDWRDYDSIYTERYMGLPEENAEAYKRSSPVNDAKGLSAKLLVIHNIEDDNVHFQNTLRMTDALEAAGKQFELFLYPQKAHGVTGAARRHMYEKMTEFLENSLR